MGRITRQTIKIEHLFRLTDKVGIIEHALAATPDPNHGYTTDDNARALQVCLRLRKTYPELSKLIETYFNFLLSAKSRQGFYNDLSSDLVWEEPSDFLGEHFGRAMNALAETASKDSDHQRRKMALDIFEQMTDFITPTLSLRTIANLIIALSLRQTIALKSASIQKKIKTLAGCLLEKKQNSSDKKWCWFEEILSYDNGRLPLALIYAYKIQREKSYLETALATLDFLLGITFNKQKAYFSFPGNKGWFTKDGKRALYGQRPIEAGSTVEACCSAFEITRKKKYYDFAKAAFAWYQGKNILNASLIDKETGGVKDGIDPRGVNPNQGAESLLSYLIAYHSLKKVQK